MVLKRIVKVGGSVITNKNSSDKPEVNFEILNKLPEAEAYVFGVGSFGHNRAMELGLSEQYSQVDVDDFAAELSGYYELIIANSNTDAPIYFGGIDCKDGKWRIISGDEIIIKLALEMACNEILYVTETGGVEMSDGSLLSEFEARNAEEVLGSMKKVDYVDATGGMYGKIKKIADSEFEGQVKFTKL